MGYKTTGKEVPMDLPAAQFSKEMIYDKLAGWIDEIFSEKEKVTLSKVYQLITSRYGLSRYDTKELLDKAVSRGYLVKEDNE